MNSRILKLSVLGMFLLFAGVVFFISGGSTGAQNKQTAILEKVREYKTWKRVVKPPVVTPEQIFEAVSVNADPLKIDISSISG